MRQGCRGNIIIHNTVKNIIYINTLRAIRKREVGNYLGEA